MKIGLVPGSFKPLQQGHMQLIEIAARENDKVLLYVSNKDRVKPNEFPIYGEDMVRVWNEILSKHLPKNVELIFTNNPVTEVYKKIEDLNDAKSQDTINIYSDEEDVQTNYPDKRISKYANVFNNIKRRGISRQETTNISGTKMRQFLADNDKKSFYLYLPDTLTAAEKRSYYDILKHTTNESLVDYLHEVLNESLNVHMTHVEDLLIDYGTSGGKKAISLLKGTIDNAEKQSDATSITIKLDGSPSIIFGTNPENDKFFVSTKSLFAKSPKIAYSEQDIKSLFGDKPDLVNKLTLAFKYLSTLDIKGIMQGDIMFTKDMLKIENIRGTQYLTFTPNTITYGIKTTNPLSKKISRSELGVAIHTTYSGSSISSLKASPIGSTTLPPDSNKVWFMPIKYNVDKNIKTDDLQKDLNDYSKILSGITLDSLPDNIAELFNIFVNGLVRSSNTKVLNDTTKTLAAFKQFITTYMQKKADELKKPESKKAKKDAADSMIKFIEDNKNDVVKYISIYNGLRNIKNKLIDRMEEAETDIETFVASPSGFRKTGQEGYAVSDNESTTKLVNRDEFSKLNFNKND